MAFSPEANYTDELPMILVPTFWGRWSRFVSATDLCGYFVIQVALQLSSRGWVDTIPDPLLLRKPGSAGNRTRDLWICRQELWPLHHGGGRSGRYGDKNIFSWWESNPGRPPRSLVATAIGLFRLPAHLYIYHINTVMTLLCGDVVRR
jgi:hypothetical protein